MDMPGFITKIQQSLHDESHWLTRRKLVIFGITLIIAGLVLGMLESEQQSEKVLKPEIIELDLPPKELPADTPPGEDDETAGALTVPVIDSWIAVKVRRGQTLDSIFRQQKIPVSLLHQIMALNAETKGLKKIRPGDLFEFRMDDHGELLQMRYALDEARYLIVRQQGGTLSAEVQQREIFSEVAEAEGVIQSSLFLAGKQAGLSDAMVMKLANIFGWDIDFILDIRKGDRFMLVYEKLYRDGEFLRHGEILAATFINQGERFQAVYFEDGDVAGYFAPDGRNMRKAFLRAPLNFSYISSGFNPRRMHPVLKRVRPHNGIDYYAPRGTPVYAAGEGKVIRSAYSRANGHHVFIKHANSIETKYLHFTNRAVKKGQRVKQGQTIGYVGSTGLATGPHLHYEFLVNGVHRNPRTVPLPKVEPLKGNRLTAFQSKAAPMLTQLSRLESASLYASRE
ncbi:MAG: peptidoglycan DD-metalloendopeptidase family protein [Xanthomonadales bacterium]|nr:peptidoglycan DD-metalloendopeptidase family protein [Xanthomonadales bacterium]MDH3940620.1 peptidoglycan DD-metalloendopeptidase family protein [Xanthomonadales bacterium]MDH3999822.1 peptidoglycan DD-metalloendopeptidase family protein [Xanthomonadales bacterium]